MNIYTTKIIIDLYNDRNHRSTIFFIIETIVK